MKTTQKIGHNENVTNLFLLANFIPSYGTNYNPANKALTLENITLVGNNGKAANVAVDNANIAESNARAARIEEFSDVDPITRSSLNALKVSGASEQTIEQGKSLAREVFGKRASELLSDDQITAAKEGGKDVKQVVVHNASVGSKINNFRKYSLFLASVPQYKPNEENIKPAALSKKLSNMELKEDALKQAETAKAVAIANRKQVLYADGTGLVEIGLNTKTYIKSVFGPNSPEYKQISGITFTKIA
jgi:hypothetical protein